jgi:hypothetical protein
MVKFEFDTPVYVHTGFGNITYDGNTYTGVGNLGGITNARESEALGPMSLNMTLDGITSDYITEALDSGNLYDVVTVYEGYRADDGTLVDDPWIVWKGWFEYAAISLGTESSIAVTCQHDLSELSEKKGDRYSDEDQQSKYSGDVGLEFTSSVMNTKLIWAGGPVGGANFNEPTRPRTKEQ